MRVWTLLIGNTLKAIEFIVGSGRSQALATPNEEQDTLVDMVEPFFENRVCDKTPVGAGNSSCLSTFRLSIQGQREEEGLISL